MDNRSGRPLSLVPPGQRVRVVYTESYDQGMVQRLSDMGLNEVTYCYK